MKRTVLSALSFIALTASFALAELPAYPGSKPFSEPAAGGPNVAVNMGNMPGMNVTVNMPNTPGASNVNTSSSTKKFTVSAATSFDDVKNFYAAQLAKAGYAEKATVALPGAALAPQTASFSTADGMKTVTVTLMANPLNAQEKLISLSESATSIK